MGSVNKVILVGRLGKDPVLRQTKNGKDFCTFTMATAKKIGQEEKTTWHNVSVFNDNTARFLNQYAVKGTFVAVEGEIEYRTYLNQDGVKMMACDIVVAQWNGDVQILLDYKPREERETHAQQGRPATTDRQQQVETEDRLDDEIPF